MIDKKYGAFHDNAYRHDEGDNNVREAKKIVLKDDSTEKWISACSVETTMLNTHGEAEDGMIRFKSAIFHLQCKNWRRRFHDDDASENCGD